MEGGGQLRRWDELLPDALGIIFANLSLQEILTVIPRVCKSWGRVVAGPYCWQEIDIDEWSSYCKVDQIGPMLQMLITRSGASLRKLSVSSIPTDDIFAFIAEHASSLQTLKIPRSEISDSIVEKVAVKLSTVTFLDVSCCMDIGAPALEAFGKHCKSLQVLHRIMHPLTVEEKICQNDEAHAIASTMPKLKQLELAYMLVDTEAVLEILLKCPQLEYLNLRGCWDVKLEDDFMKEKCPSLKVLGPVVDESERDYWEDCSDFSESESFLAWQFLADDLVEVDFENNSFDDGSSGDGWDDELETRFNEGFE